jgi:hypothetical protein
MNRRAGLAATLAFVAAAMAAPASAQDRQIRGFIGTTFAGSSTFVDLTTEDAPSHPHFTLGAQATWLWEVFGIDVDVADTPGFFEGGGTNLIIKSRVTSFTGNVVIGVPRRMTEYSLRLYFVGGGGIMRVSWEDALGVFDTTKVVPAVDFGVGAQGFLTKTVGLSWELRRFQRVGEPPPLTGITVGGSEQLSYWRAHMGVVVRY